MDGGGGAYQPPPPPPLSDDYDWGNQAVWAGLNNAHDSDIGTAQSLADQASQMGRQDPRLQFPIDDDNDGQASIATSYTGSFSQPPSPARSVFSAATCDDSDLGADAVRRGSKPRSCQACRASKRRCDKKFPCSSCVRAGRTCVALRHDGDSWEVQSVGSEGIERGPGAAQGAEEWAQWQRQGHLHHPSTGAGDLVPAMAGLRPPPQQPRKRGRGRPPTKGTAAQVAAATVVAPRQQAEREARRPEAAAGETQQQGVPVASMMIQPMPLQPDEKVQLLQQQQQSVVGQRQQALTAAAVLTTAALDGLLRKPPLAEIVSHPFAASRQASTATQTLAKFLMPPPPPQPPALARARGPEHHQHQPTVPPPPPPDQPGTAEPGSKKRPREVSGANETERPEGQAEWARVPEQPLSDADARALASPGLFRAPPGPPMAAARPLACRGRGVFIDPRPSAAGMGAARVLTIDKSVFPTPQQQQQQQAPAPAPAARAGPYIGNHLEGCDPPRRPDPAPPAPTVPPPPPFPADAPRHDTTKDERERSLVCATPASPAPLPPQPHRQYMVLGAAAYVAPPAPPLTAASLAHWYGQGKEEGEGGGSMRMPDGGPPPWEIMRVSLGAAPGLAKYGHIVAGAAKAMGETALDLLKSGEIQHHKTYAVMRMWDYFSYRRRVDATGGVANVLARVLAQVTCGYHTYPPGRRPLVELQGVAEDTEMLTRRQEDALDSSGLPPYVRTLHDDGAGAAAGYVYANGEYRLWCGGGFERLYMTTEEANARMEAALVLPSFILGEVLLPECRADFYQALAQHMFTRVDEETEVTIFAEAQERSGRVRTCMVRARFLVLNGGQYACLALHLKPFTVPPAMRAAYNPESAAAQHHPAATHHGGPASASLPNYGGSRDGYGHVWPPPLPQHQQNEL